jgi:hypothetical protein
MIASIDMGHQQEFNFVLRASDSVLHSFNFVFYRTLSFMASADDNSVQLPAYPGFLLLPSCGVTRRTFYCIPCSKVQAP